MVSNIKNKVTNFTDTFNNLIKKKKITPKNLNTFITSGYTLDKDPFSYPITLTILSLIALGFIFYAMYYYFTDISGIQHSKSFYSHDIATYTPLFEKKYKTIEECIERCERDPLCSGVTYNYDTQHCSGTENGIIREENNNFSAWVKPNDSYKVDINLGIISSFADGPQNIKASEFIEPFTQGEFCYSFYITINDFYENFGVWRHVFHKGTEMDNSNDTGYKLEYQNWENLSADYPEQSIGVWLAPFTNNLRICYTTIQNQNMKVGSNLHAFIQKCNSLTDECYITDMPGGNYTNTNMIGDGSVVSPKLTKNIEYIDDDLQNIPINRPVHISVNFNSNTVELYINGNLRKITSLNGTPEFNKKEHLYIMYPKSFKGNISKLTYIPKYVGKEEIIKMKGNGPTKD